SDLKAAGFLFAQVTQLTVDVLQNLINSLVELTDLAIKALLKQAPFLVQGERLDQGAVELVTGDANGLDQDLGCEQRLEVRVLLMQAVQFSGQIVQGLVKTLVEHVSGFNTAGVQVIDVEIIDAEDPDFAHGFQYVRQVIGNQIQERKNLRMLA